jgi:hypothetical protein
MYNFPLFFSLKKNCDICIISFFTQQGLGEYIHNTPLEVSLKDVMDRRQAKNQLNNDDTHYVLFCSEVTPMQGVKFAERIDAHKYCLLICCERKTLFIN